MRLIDADTLLTQIKYKPVPNIIDETWNELYERVIEEIDNAPTITPTLQIEDITDETIAKFVMIWQRATSKGLILEPERPQGEYVDISKLRLMTVEECAGHTIDYAMGWKACIEWIKKGGAE